MPSGNGRARSAAVASTAGSTGAVGARRPSARSRVYGLGSDFGKALRDSRNGATIVLAFFYLIWALAGTSLARTFGTVATRADAVKLSETLPPVITGLYGGTQPNMATLGGFTNWRYGMIFFLVPGVWSLVALSKTLTGDVRRGSMEFVAAGPVSRRRIALQRLGAHVAAMAAVMLVAAVVIWAVAQFFGRLSATDVAVLGGTGSDAIAFGAALSYVLLTGFIGLAVGAVAFALAPFVGRAAAAGVAGAVMAAAWLVYGYRESIALFDSLKFLSIYYWTAGHRPVAGTYDWVSLVAVVAIVVVGFTIGVAAFERRDLAVRSLRLFRLPRALLGLRGPLGRSASERLAGALAWGLGIGAYAFIVAASGDALRDSIAGSEQVMRIFQLAFPGTDINAPGFAVQLAFASFGYLAVGIAASRLAAGWSSDESDGRLELLLATPAVRARWFVQGALGVFVALLALTVIIALAIGAGVAASGSGSVIDPMAGTGTLLLYGLAVAGIGFGFGGVWRSGAAGVGGLVVVVGTLLLDLLVPALKLPDWLHDGALTTHYGQAMLGRWNWVGVVLSLGLAIGGVAVGACGFSRRDLSRGG